MWVILGFTDPQTPVSVLGTFATKNQAVSAMFAYGLTESPNVAWTAVEVFVPDDFFYAEEKELI